LLAALEGHEEVREARHLLGPHAEILGDRRRDLVRVVEQQVDRELEAAHAFGDRGRSVCDRSRLLRGEDAL